ncbi:MAG: cysteine desulfurase [Synechococcales cyanobacterium CRU_2_2]|nr:cysteine desulfurase [Synechococcales cyanobacterium CRU_2_2]
MQIYLDYSATTPTRPEAIATLQHVLTEEWGNPSSLHHWGQRSALAIETARWAVAQLIGAPPESLVFTSGGTESNNLAILGVARRVLEPRHLIISSLEHSAVEKPAQMLEQQGWRVTRLPVDAQGRIDPEDLRVELQDDTALVSVIYGQSEVGTLQPLAELAAIAHEAGVLFHTDAVQVAGRVPLDVGQLKVDLLSLSSHKLYGPQGVGALYVRPGVELTTVFGGGSQEGDRRPGTQAVAAIAAFGTAARLAAQELESESQRLVILRDRLITQLVALAGVELTGDRHHRLPHHASFSIERAVTAVSGRQLVYQMNLAGIGISAGSACDSGQSVPSRVLKAMGYGDRAALSAIRLTLGKQTTTADVDWAALALGQILDRNYS